MYARTLGLLLTLMGGVSGAAHAASVPTDYQAFSLVLDTNHIEYSAATNTLWATTPSLAGYGVGNSVAGFDLDSWTFSHYSYVGSEPTALAVSDDGQFVYAGLSGSNSIKRYNTLTGVVDLTIPLGSDGSWGSGPYYAEDIEVMPGSPETIAVSLRNQGYSPRHEGVVIIDGATMRSTQTAGHTGANRIEFGDSPDVLYGYNNETTDFGLRTMLIDENGVTTTDVQRSLIAGFGVDIEYDGGRIYSTTGRVVDPSTGLIEGTYNLCGYSNCYGSAIEPDSANGVTYVANSSLLSIFDQATFTQMASYDLSGVSGSIIDLISLGDGQLAFNTTGGQLFVLTPVPEPETYGMFLAGLGMLGAVAKRRRA